MLFINSRKIFSNLFSIQWDHCHHDSFIFALSCYSTKLDHDQLLQVIALLVDVMSLLNLLSFEPSRYDGQAD